MLVGDILARGRAAFGGRVAVIDGETAVTYAELDERVNGLATALAGRGVTPGDRVVLLLPTGLPFLETYFAVARAGGVAVPVGTRLSAAEVAFLTRHAGARIVVHDAALADRVAHAGEDVRRIAVGGDAAGSEPYAPLVRPAATGPRVTRDATDDAAIFYTSGTTGDPKGVRLTHGGVAYCATIVREAFRTGSDDVALCQLPLSHVNVHFVPFPVLLGGGTVVLDRGFQVDRAFDLLVRHGVTQLVSVTATAMLLAKHAEAHPGRFALPRLRKLFTGGSHVPAGMLEAWRRLAPRSATVNCYGMTEMGSAVARMDPDAMPFRAGSVGLPYRGIEIRVGDGLPAGAIGEIHLRSPSQMAGYWANPEATAATLVDGWLRTGDMGYRDDDGYLYLVGRRAHRLKRGGETIFPAEIEAVIATLHEVKEVAVVGRHDDVMGDRLVAAVALQPGSRLDAQRIVAHCAAELAEFKVPEYVAILAPELPKNATGKVDAHALARMADAGELELADFRRGRVGRP